MRRLKNRSSLLFVSGRHTGSSVVFRLSGLAWLQGETDRHSVLMAEADFCWQPIQILNSTIDVLKPGKLPSGKTEIPFEFPLHVKGSKVLYETYHGVFVNIQVSSCSTYWAPLSSCWRPAWLSSFTEIAELRVLIMAWFQDCLCAAVLISHSGLLTACRVWLTHAATQSYTPSPVTLVWSRNHGYNFFLKVLLFLCVFSGHTDTIRGADLLQSPSGTSADLSVLFLWVSLCVIPKGCAST